MKTGSIKALALLVSLTLMLSACGGDVGQEAKSSAELAFEDEIASLMQGNESIDGLEKNGISLLCWAVEKDYVDASRTLLESAASPEATAIEGATETALFSTIKALSFGNDAKERRRIDKSRAIAELLIQHGAKVNHVTLTKETPLRQAALRGRADLCDLFIRNGARVNVTDAIGNTPLHDAAKQGYWEAAQVLLSSGADASLANRLGETALSLARKRGEEPLNQDARQESADYNPASDYDRTIELLELGSR